MYNIGIQIKMYRERRGMSQKEFAQRINSKNTAVSNWEKGLTRPDVDTLSDICSVLEVSADDLLDIKLTPGNLTAHEHKLIMEYRRKLEMQLAIDTLLGLNDNRQ